MDFNEYLNYMIMGTAFRGAEKFGFLKVTRGIDYGC